MSEKRTPLQELKEQTPRPNLLDVVKINNRWAQVVGGGDRIRYLDNQDTVEISWDDYQLTKDWTSLPVREIKESANFSSEELKNVHWGPEQEQYPYLKEEVRVFGEFKKTQKTHRKTIS